MRLLWFISLFISLVHILFGVNEDRPSIQKEPRQLDPEALAINQEFQDSKFFDKEELQEIEKGGALKEYSDVLGLLDQLEFKFNRLSGHLNEVESKLEFDFTSMGGDKSELAQGLAESEEQAQLESQKVVDMFRDLNSQYQVLLKRLDEFRDNAQKHGPPLTQPELEELKILLAGKEKTNEFEQIATRVLSGTIRSVAETAPLVSLVVEVLGVIHKMRLLEKRYHIIENAKQEVSRQAADRLNELRDKCKAAYTKKKDRVTAWFNAVASRLWRQNKLIRAKISIIKNQAPFNEYTAESSQLESQRFSQKPVPGFLERHIDGLAYGGPSSTINEILTDYVKARSVDETRGADAAELLDPVMHEVGKMNLALFAPAGRPVAAPAKVTAEEGAAVAADDGSEDSQNLVPALAEINTSSSSSPKPGNIQTADEIQERQGMSGTILYTVIAVGIVLTVIVVAFTVLITMRRQKRRARNTMFVSHI